VERRDGGEDFATTNLQSLCHPCHNTKTANERRRRQTS
jgi:5-methylcytosine-specific restriction endonuclease McrA